MDVPQPTFGELVRHHRTGAGLTQEALAERAGLSVRGVRYAEHGLRRPYPDTVDRLAVALALDDGQRSELLRAARPSQPDRGDDERPLPRVAGRLIGRQDDLANLAALLSDSSAAQIVTLTGPGGVGKTTLAAAVAAELNASFAGDVVWVALAALDDPRLVPQAIAEALGVMQPGADDRADIVAALRQRRPLLVLDNMEHLPATAGFISDLAAAAPHTRLLVTSRSALRLRAEQEVSLAPLPTPRLGDDDVANNPAVQLFLEHALHENPGITLNGANASAIAEICRRLDGLPLALELAAARTRVLRPAALLGRLDGHLSFAARDIVDAPQRHRTLRDTIAWSHELLDPAAQRLFRHLSIFAGGATLPSIEDVCVAAGDEPAEILDCVEALHRSSLIRLVDDATGEEPRVAMLETIRAFALEELDRNGERDHLGRLHAEHFTALVEEGAYRFFTPDQARWLDRLTEEQDNLRSALKWCATHGQPEIGLRLTAAAWMSWYVHGYAEGRILLAALLQLPETEQTMRPRAASLHGGAQIALWQGDYEVARAYAVESVALYRRLGDDRGIAEALLTAGFVERMREQYDVAEDTLQEALMLARGIGHRFIIAASLHHLGMLAADATGDNQRARTLMAESLELYRSIPMPRFVGLVLTSLGDMARACGDHAQAIELIRAGLRTMTESGEEFGVTFALDIFARSEAERGDLGVAVRLAGAASRLREARGIHLGPTEKRKRASWLAAARAALGDAAFETAWEEGRTRPREEAIATVLGDVSKV